QENFCDATLVCEDKHIPVHKIVLSCCSEFFEDIFIRTPCRHPFIVLKDIPLIDLEALLDYMYKGRVSIFQSRLSNLMKASDSLKIKGLSVSEDHLSQVIVSPKEKSSFPKVAKRKSNTLLVEEGESACSTSRKKRPTSPGPFQTNKTKLNPDDKNKNKSSNETMYNSNDDMLSNMGDPVVVLERHLSLSEDQLYIVKDKNEEVSKKNCLSYY
ncbi:UNVERIFIED_CONTAM: hypothetical protein GTU68_005177, partial [Idotea baltica]|nr:hypothetical protein [Idotea baltica]